MTDELDKNLPIVKRLGEDKIKESISINCEYQTQKRKDENNGELSAKRKFIGFCFKNKKLIEGDNEYYYRFLDIYNKKTKINDDWHDETMVYTQVVYIKGKNSGFALEEIASISLEERSAGFEFGSTFVPFRFKKEFVEDKTKYVLDSHEKIDEQEFQDAFDKACELMQIESKQLKLKRVELDKVYSR